jgi:predicted transglutaminase-like cysteine proteinase
LPKHIPKFRYPRAFLWRAVAVTSLGVGLLFGTVEAKASWKLERILHQAEKRYGRQGPAKDQLLSWRDLIESSQQLSEVEKLQAVNHYFNRHVRFSTDITLWKQGDYWATPIETLVKGAGDCEDFSLVKYFTLRQLGVPVEKLRISYAKLLKTDQAHMVMTYYATPAAEPLVLDNLIDRILPASAREDLSLLYAFDAEGLYLVEAKGLKRVGDTEHLPYWSALLKRMRKEGFTAEPV